MSWIVRVALFAVALSAPSQVSPASKAEEKAVLAVVDQFMHAVSRDDPAGPKMNDLRLDGGFTIVERPAPTGGMLVTRRPYKAPAADAPPAAAATGPSNRERYWDAIVHVRGSVAVVWTPYEFWLDGKTSHCGIDVFDMMKEGGVWKIANMMWTVEPEACASLRPTDPAKIRPAGQAAATDAAKFLTQPLVSAVYTADPSAHVFDGRIFIYPSHDIEAGIPSDDLGSQFAMRDYHVFSMDTAAGPVTDHGVALDIRNVPWAGRQMWAPDAAEKGGKYYLYFPAKDKQDVFRIGAAVSDKPAGPFVAQPEPIKGSYSIDPAVFKDSDGRYYMYFGGIWGGQLQRWATGAYRSTDVYPANDQAALSAKVARLGDDMVSFSEAPKDVIIQDERGKPLTAGDNARRFFEASWLHKYNGTYYFSYSTGDTHFIMYATGTSPYGPFTVRGKILEPVLGWTNHHSIVEFKGKWYLFYHDAQLSGGQTHLRNIKMIELTHRPDGTIVTIDAYRE